MGDIKTWGILQFAAVFFGEIVVISLGTAIAYALWSLSEYLRRR